MSPCFGCGVSTTPDADQGWEWYMVWDDVWAQAGMGPGFLCVGCLEERLGRSVKGSDLMQIPVNIPTRIDTPRLRTIKTEMVNGLPFSKQLELVGQMLL